MLFLRSWLEEYIDLSSFDNESLGDVITMKSSEVEEIIRVDDYFNNKVLIGRIENVRLHPDADKLRIFEVNLGSQMDKVTIVSAANNVKEGLFVPLATIGTQLPFLTITPRKLRGIESFGMCCGKSELTLEDQSSGLWELNDIINNDSSFLGQSIVSLGDKYFKQESIFDIKVLPDRMGTIGSHLGMALEIAICTENYDLLTQRAKDLLNPEKNAQKLQSISKADNKASSAEKLSLVFDNLDKQYVNNFELITSHLLQEYTLPHLYQRRMFLLKQNLSGTISDLSNYLLLDIGQPTHFFDLDKVTKL
jgi:phenylalanyl-tRNA synthetase beta chain